MHSVGGLPPHWFKLILRDSQGTAKWLHYKWLQYNLTVNVTVLLEIPNSGITCRTCKALMTAIPFGLQMSYVGSHTVVHMKPIWEYCHMGPNVGHSLT